MERDESSARLLLSVPEGYSGMITVDYVSPKIWRIAELISVVGFITFFAAWGIKRRRRSDRKVTDLT